MHVLAAQPVERAATVTVPGQVDVVLRKSGHKVLSAAHGKQELGTATNRNARAVLTRSTTITLGTSSDRHSTPTHLVLRGRTE